MPEKIVNLKQLSECLGLSQTTVSRALNGFPEVSEKTRQRVLAAAAEFNYRPSPSATSLATGRTRVIGHVVPLSVHRMINPHFSDFMGGASEAYARAGYDMLIRVVREEEEESVYRDFARRSRVDGVVVHGPLVDEPRIPLLQSIGLPFVVHGRGGGEALDYSWLDVNSRGAFLRATEFLADLGHRRIALVNGLETMNFAHRRRQGYETGLAARGIDLDPALITSEDMVEPYGYRATLQFLALPQPPTAILFSSVLPAMGAVRALSEMGLRPGSDVSLLTFDDRLSFLQSGAASHSADIPFLTAMRSSIWQAGQRVAEMLIHQIESKSEDAVQELWEAELVVGRSTAPCKELGRSLAKEVS